MTLLAFSFEPPLINSSTYKHRHPAPVFFRAFFSVASRPAPGPQRGEGCCLRASAICISSLPQSPAALGITVLLRFHSPLGLTPITSLGHVQYHAAKRREIRPDFSAQKRPVGAPRNVAR
jgi:hypothetical protein